MTLDSNEGVANDAPSADDGAAVRRLVPRRAPIPVAMWPVGGSYVGRGDSYRVEAMLDVDSGRGVALLSIDFYGLDGDPGSHIGACAVRSATLTSDHHHTLIRGIGRFTFAAAAPVIEVRIERRSVLCRRAPARISFLSTALVPGAHYLCEYRGHARHARGCETSPVCTVLPFLRPLDGTTG